MSKNRSQTLILDKYFAKVYLTFLLIITQDVQVNFTFMKDSLSHPRLEKHVAFIGIPMSFTTIKQYFD